MKAENQLYLLSPKPPGMYVYVSFVFYVRSMYMGIKLVGQINSNQIKRVSQGQFGTHIMDRGFYKGKTFHGWDDTSPYKGRFS